jgi:putative bacteriocin precursor
MKKLTKKMKSQRESVEAYAYCSCVCGCPCLCYCISCQPYSSSDYGSKQGTLWRGNSSTDYNNSYNRTLSSYGY